MYLYNLMLSAIKLIILYLLLHCLQDLRNVLCTVPEIIELVGGADAEQSLPVNEMDRNHELEAVLESIFSQILLSSKDKICQSLSKLKWRLNLEKKVPSNHVSSL